MRLMKQIALQIPGMKTVRRKYWQRDALRQLRSQSTAEVFNSIYENNAWEGEHSRSGPGSDPSQTKAVSDVLPYVLRQLNVKSLLDVPCGDFQWMKDVDLGGIDYLGADIVPEIVMTNNDRFSDRDRRFMILDMLTDSIPKVDLVFCRDCLVHLSNNAVLRALRNIAESESKFLLTTTFPSRTINTDILTGQWRVLNLEVAPFNLPRPLGLIREKCTEGDGEYADKSLGLWEMAAVKAAMENTTTERQAGDQ